MFNNAIKVHNIIGIFLEIRKKKKAQNRLATTSIHKMLFLPFTKKAIITSKYAILENMLALVFNTSKIKKIPKI